MNETRLRRTLPDQSSGSGYTIDTSHHSVTNTILSKRVCFYKSGDPQFNGFRVVINNRTFKTFDALLDSLSKKVPLPFGVRNITTPRGVHGINTLDELEDGKSYICSDNRKVKPIDLALARRKLPPWYHARPASSRRRTAKFFPGWKNIHREDPVVFRTPKKLVVFRNGNPSVRYTVLLHKKTTPSYESILGHISELMQFHVSKLHTPNGQRIDGFPGLILCSGSVVAVGREPFRPVEYSAEKPPSPTRRHSKQRAFKRQKTSVSKTMTPSFSSKSRNFSASSERYIVHQIHNSIAESSCDLPSNITNSIESDSDRILESLTETEVDTCLSKGGDEGQDGALSNDDNIEKSFRVNQDGSMTVEMKVRLTIKEEETVQWTTTLTRSVVADQLNVPCLLDSDPDQEVCLKNSQTSAASTDIIHKDRTRDENDDDPPLLGNGAFIDSCQEVDDFKDHTEGAPPRRAPTPGCKTRSKLQSSVDSFEDVSVDKYEEGKVGSYFFGEETENRTTEQFYLDQKGTRPVPKPRQLGSVDANSRDFSAFKSTEIMQTESSREEVTETVLHIYEQQTCHDNFLANVGVHSMPASGATSETRQLCSSNEFDLWRPSLAFEPVSKWRTDSRSVTSDLHLASLKAGAKREQLQQATESYVKPGEKEVKKDQCVSSRPRKHVRLVMTAGKRRKKGSVKATENRKRVKPFSSAVFIKRIYGNKAKPPNKIKKIKKRAKATSNSLPKPNAKNANVQLPLKEKMSKPILSKTEAETSHPQRELTWQSKNESSHLSKDRPSQPFNPSSSVAKEYVEKWLKNARSNPSSTQDKESKIAEGLTPTQTQTNVGHFSEETPKTSKTFEITSSENVITPSVKLRVQSFEHKSTPAVEKTRARPKNAKHYATNAKVENYHSLSQKDTQAKHFVNGFCSEILPPRSETNERNQDRNMTTPTRTVSMELPPPPPELLIAEDFSESVTSSPMSSQRSDNYPVSMSPTSDKAISPDNKMEKPTSAQNQNPLGELSRASSIKRAPLVNNCSLESKMSLRNTTLDKYASDYEATEEGTPLSAHISTVGDEICLRRTTQQVKATSEETQQSVLELGTPSFCTSVSPLSLTSDERMSPSSVVSSETSFLGNIPIQETKMVKTPQIEKQSPKNLMKRPKLKSSPSPERKFHSKKSSELQNTSPELSAMTGRLLDEHVISNKGLQRPETPNATPSTERKHHETKELQRTSPYSQSLDVVSPPSRHKSKKLPRNISLDSPSESKNRRPKKTSSQRESHLTAQIEADNSEEAKATEVISVMPESINAANQPNMKPVLEKICYSIKSIRQITQNKRPSCLEKSNSLPDFSSHVSSTFGSSSKVLLAFLAVMTLKDGLTNLNMKELNANNVSCSEALKMIDSLREIANIEDSQRLRNSLSDLQQSASIQLLQSWRGFQELGDRCKSHSATPNDSEAGLGTGAGPELDCGIGENVIDEIIDNLEIPQKLKEELVSLSEDAEGGNNIGGNMQYSRLKLLANQNYHENTKNVYTEDCVVQDDKPNVDARSIVKNITDINQPKQSEVDRIPLLSDEGKYKPTGRTTEDNGCHDWLHSVADSKNNPQEKQIYSTTSLNLQSWRGVAHDDNLDKQKQHQQANLSVKSTQERAKNNGDVCSETKPVKQELYMDYSQLTRNEKNIGTELTEEAKSDPDEKTHMTSSVNKGCCEQDTEKRQEIIHQEIKPMISTSPNLSRLSVEKQPNSNYNVEMLAKGKKTTFNSGSENLQEDDPSEIKCKLLQSQMCSMGLNKSSDDSTGSSDVEEPSSEEEQPEVDYKKLQVIIEESLSGNEEEEAEPLHDLSKCAEQTKKRELEALREEPEEDEVSLEYEDQYADERKQQSSPDKGSIGLLENPDLCIKKENSNLIISERFRKDFRFNVDDDSGNDNSSFEEHVDEVQLKDEVKQISSLIEEELSSYEKYSSSEKEQVCTERKMKEGYAHNRETPPRVQLEDSNLETIERQSDVITQSVAERVTLLEQQVAEAQRPKLAPKSSPIRRFSQRKSPPELVDSPSELLLCTRSAPQSSLSFSYDSSGVITTEPEGSSVRSIREMFLARSATDIQQRGLLSSNLSELRAETSGSGGYQSQTSSDLSSSEDVLAQKSISKGLVKRAIEMLYGKKDLKPEEPSERSPSEPDQRKTSIFSPFHAAGSKAMSELSYFNSSNALDIFSEATRCIAFNAQVGPGDSVPIDNGRWLFREKTSMRKSVSDPIGINKTFTNTFHNDGLCKDTEEKTPYSLFSTKPEVEDGTKSQPGKCTYFSLPYASESEVCQDEMGAVSMSNKNEDDVLDSAEETKDSSEDSKTWAERNSILPGIGAADFKMKGNKVHPLVELPPDGEVVVVQPGKGQGVVSRRIQEPDVLDLLYNFCGEHCPIL
ncbi:uncharacterized protein LOC124857834 [Girardinichthys multiradiatus]|uniref:uncharacterized protein LOC124857834 n=1 Tax=Girardinichthys multiradiatus TaxID=208333 RepID=UPI001FAB67A9|nr:uncharacterized protein LOC124857834 [Girardinichthys multiradiatus]XP_047205289.1 uncharacterized protein LOC124857834 [Girardinichthys multiradiatus]